MAGTGNGQIYTEGKSLKLENDLHFSMTSAIFFVIRWRKKSLNDLQSDKADKVTSAKTSKLSAL